MGKKVKKATETQKESIDIIKEYLNEYVSSNPDALSVEFAEQNTKNNVYFISTVFYKNFQAVIKFDGYMLFQENNFDIAFKYENSEYYFSIYDIFNYFDISDFETYYYQNCLGKDSIIYALDKFTDLVYRYYRDIEKAGSQENLPYLVNQFEKDKEKANGESWKEDINDPDGLDFSHIFYLTTSAKSKEKLIKRLEKYDSKDNLTLYEKRLLKYLKDGNEMVETQDISEKYDKKVRSIKLKVYSIIIALVLIVYVVAELAGLRYYFGDGYVPSEDFLSIVSGLYFPKFMIVPAFVFSCAFLIYAFGKKIVYKLCPDNVKSYYLTNEKKEAGEKKIERFGNKYIIPVVALVISAVLFLFANTGVSFTEDCLRVHKAPLLLEEISYDDLEVCKVLKYYDDDEDNLVDYEGKCYALLWDDGYYIMTECADLSETDKAVMKIAGNKPIKEVESEDDIYNMYGF